MSKQDNGKSKHGNRAYALENHKSQKNYEEAHLAK